MFLLQPSNVVVVVFCKSRILCIYLNICSTRQAVDGAPTIFDFIFLFVLTQHHIHTVLLSFDGVMLVCNLYSCSFFARLCVNGIELNKKCFVLQNLDYIII